LVPETEISKYYLYHERLRSLTEQVNKNDLFEVLRVTCEELIVPRDDELLRAMKKFRDMFFQRPHMMRAFRKTRLYHCSIEKLLQEHDPLRVSSIEGLIGLRNKFSKQSYPKDRKPVTRHERLVDRLEDWMLDAQILMRDGRDPGPVPTDLIEDDPVILKNSQSCLEPVLILVSDDRKLQLEIEKLTSKVVYRVSMKDWFLNECDEGKFILALKTFSRIKPIDIRVEMDNGSLEAYLLKIDYTRKDRTVPKLGWHSNINYKSLRENLDDYEILGGDYHREINNKFVESFMHISSHGLNRLREYIYRSEADPER